MCITWVFTCFPMPVDPFLGKIPSNFLTWDFPEVGIQSRWASSTQGWAMFVFCHIFAHERLSLFLVTCWFFGIKKSEVSWNIQVSLYMSSTFALNSEIVCFLLMQDCSFCEGPFFQDLKWKRANQNTWISTSHGCPRSFLFFGVVESSCYLKEVPWVYSLIFR